MFVCFTATALAIKGIQYNYKAVHLIKDGGEQVMNYGLYVVFAQNTPYIH